MDETLLPNQEDNSGFVSYSSNENILKPIGE